MFLFNNDEVDDIIVMLVYKVVINDVFFIIVFIDKGFLLFLFE